MGWKTTQDLGLMGDLVVEWNHYVTRLVNNFIHLEEDESDKLIWTKNGKCGSFSAKLGYEVATKDENEGEHLWWWTKILKTLGPLKTILTLWLVLSNKILT